MLDEFEPRIAESWSANADKPSNQADQRGNWQYCGQVSGTVINDFFKKWTNAQSPEPKIM